MNTDSTFVYNSALNLAILSEATATLNKRDLIQGEIGKGEVQNLIAMSSGDIHIIKDSQIFESWKEWQAGTEFQINKKSEDFDNLPDVRTAKTPEAREKARNAAISSYRGKINTQFKSAVNETVKARMTPENHQFSISYDKVESKITFSLKSTAKAKKTPLEEYEALIAKHGESVMLDIVKAKHGLK